MKNELTAGIPRLSLKVLLPLLILTAGYRVIASSVDYLGNTAPLMAIAFGGAMLLGLRFWWLPVVLLVVSDLILGLFHAGGGLGWYTVMSIGFYGLVAFIGGRAGHFGKIWPTMWCGTLLCSVLFYGVANTYSWAMWPGYEKSLVGWWQSQTTGVPGVDPPAWMFLRNSLIADSIWCGIAGLLFFAPRRTGPVVTAKVTGS